MVPLPPSHAPRIASADQVADPGVSIGAGANPIILAHQFFLEKKNPQEIEKMVGGSLVPPSPPPPPQINHCSPLSLSEILDNLCGKTYFENIPVC